MSGFISPVIDVTPLKPALKVLQWELTAKAVIFRILRFLPREIISLHGKFTIPRGYISWGRNDKGDIEMT